jgi:release factor glutamine methyltransferase
MPPTLGSARRETSVALTPSSPTAHLDAEVLLRHVTGCSPADLVARAERVLTETETQSLRELVARRRAGEPVAYLTGSREFWSMTLQVTPAVLIPRPETELLVEQALARIPPDARWNIADLGTGSGAIALALAHERPGCRVHAGDNSIQALDVARANAARLGVANIEFFHGDWLAPLAHRTLEMIVSNPPYVRAGDRHLNEGDVRFEPISALVGGADGLDAIRAIAKQAFARLLPGGWLLLEHGPDQATAVADILTAAGFCEILCHRDLAGRDRVTECRAAPTGC